MYGIRVKFSKTGKLRFISHLDLMRLFQRAVRRAELPLTFTEGYNPHHKISIALALPVGISSEAEYADFEFSQRINTEDFKERMNKNLPEGILFLEAKSIGGRSLSLSQIINLAVYEIKIKVGFSDKIFIETIEKFKQSQNIPFVRERKRKISSFNIKERIENIDIIDEKDKIYRLNLECKIGERAGVSPLEVIESIKNFESNFKDIEILSIHRNGLFYLKNGERISPLEVDINVG